MFCLNIAKLSSQSGRTVFLTLRSETGARSIRFFLLLARFLRLTRCLQAGELLMKLAAYPWSPYTEKENILFKRIKSVVKVKCSCNIYIKLESQQEVQG